MFFENQNFGSFNLEGYIMKDICIPNTDIHIYEFKCGELEGECADESSSKKLDELTHRLNETYNGKFQIVNSDSSQYFCGSLYPLIVKFETKLRYAVYVSGALYNKEKISIEALEIGYGQKKKSIEEADFGQIYEALFTDNELQSKIGKLNDKKWTKADFMNKIDEIEENSMWEKIVGKDYRYIASNFLKIKDFRNGVMHNHLISYDTYINAKEILKKAHSEIEQVIKDKLITNKSKYSNDVNVLDDLNQIFESIRLFATVVDKFFDSEKLKTAGKGLERFSEVLSTSDCLQNKRFENISRGKELIDNSDK